MVDPVALRRSRLSGWFDIVLPMFTELLDVLDRQWEFLDSHKDISFVAHLSVFIRQLEGHPRFGAHLRDMLREECGLDAAYEEAEKAACRDLSDLRDELLAAIPSMAPERMTTTAGGLEFDHVGWGAFGRFIEGRRPIDPGEEPNKRAVPGRLVSIVRSQIARHEENCGPFAPQNIDGPRCKHDLRKYGERASQIEQTWMCAWRERTLQARTFGGAALARLLDVLRVINPIQNAHLGTDLGDLFWHIDRRKDGVGGLYAELYKPVNEASPSMGTALFDCMKDALNVYSDLRRRLGEARSLLALIEGFKHRAEWYDAEHLRSVAAKRTRVSEDRLSEQLAVYLFDQGLAAFVKPMMGRLQPDLYAPGPFHLYVESKIGKSRDYILRGAKQVWNNVARVQSMKFPIREVFLVVFRLGETSWQLPHEVRNGDLVMYPRQIDLAPGEMSGSRHKGEIVTISERDLLPTPRETNRRGKATQKKTP